MDRYKIVRKFLNGRSRTIERGLSLEQAQAHCSNPETSSRTATGKVAKARTRKHGDWFDCYYRE
jgi:hypothetical protein